MAAKPPHLKILQCAHHEWKCCNRTPISKGVSQLRNHPLAHECHFAAAKWATKIALLREIHPPLRKCSKLQKWATKFPFYCQMIPNFQMAVKWSPRFKMAVKMFLFSPWAAKFPFGCEMISQPHSYPLWNPPFALKMAFWLRNDFPNFKMVVKWFPNFEMGCKNVFLFSLWLQDDLQAIKMTCKMEGGLKKHFAKPREVVKMPIEPRTMHLKRRALSLRSHTWSLSFHFLPPKTIKAYSSSWGNYAI